MSNCATSMKEKEGVQAAIVRLPFLLCRCAAAWLRCLRLGFLHRLRKVLPRFWGVGLSNDKTTITHNRHTHRRRKERRSLLSLSPKKIKALIQSQCIAVVIGYAVRIITRIRIDADSMLYKK